MMAGEKQEKEMSKSGDVRIPVAALMETTEISQEDQGEAVIADCLHLASRQ